MLGVAEQSGSELLFRFDSSKPMGKALANSPSHALNVKDLLDFITFNCGTDSLIDLWESICEKI
jgi:hypothetical protein